MSTKTLGWLVGARDGKKLESGWDPLKSIPTLSQPGPFQTFAVVGKVVNWQRVWVIPGRVFYNKSILLTYYIFIKLCLIILHLFLFFLPLLHCFIPSFSLILLLLLLHLLYPLVVFHFLNTLCAWSSVACHWPFPPIHPSGDPLHLCWDGSKDCLPWGKHLRQC